MKNASLDTEKTWVDEEGRKFTELIRQEYTGNNCVFSGGLVENANPKCDTLYISLEKDGVEPITILLRPDEIASLNWICAGLLFSENFKFVEADHGQE